MAERPIEFTKSASRQDQSFQRNSQIDVSTQICELHKEKKWKVHSDTKKIEKVNKKFTEHQKNRNNVALLIFLVAPIDIYRISVWKEIRN